MSLKPIKKKRLFEEILIAIEEYIKNENIRAGEKLPSENELATTFEVSKTAVREAMSVLHANGVIEKRTGAGIFLRQLDPNESIVNNYISNLFNSIPIKEILEFRRGVEVEAVSIAANRATAEDISEIQNAHQQLILANESGELGLEEDYKFHYSIILASHNSIYKEVFEKVAYRFEEGMKVSKMQSAKVPGRFVEAFKEHEDILKGIINGDSLAASEAMRNHLNQNERKIWNYIEGEN